MSDPVPSASPAVIRAELSRVLRFSDFSNSVQLTQFLQFIVDESLASRADQLKERTIAVGAFGRSRDFDSRLDCVVRVAASRLRRSLQRYYATDGAANPLRIEVPKGAYQPTFRVPSPAGDSRADGSPAGGWQATTSPSSRRGPILAVAPFDAVDVVGEDLALSLAEDLSVQLSRTSRYDVADLLAVRELYHQRQSPRDIAALLQADLLLTGTIRCRGGAVRITGQLTDERDRRILWAEQIDLEYEPIRIDAHDAIVRRMVQSLEERWGNWDDDVAPQDDSQPHDAKDDADRETSLVT